MANKGGWQEFSREEATAPGLARGAAPATPKAQRRVRVQRTKAGKGGKLVTAITGLELPDPEAKELLKALKASCGTGGTVKDGRIEIQGDHRETVAKVLASAGFRPVMAGG